MYTKNMNFIFGLAIFKELYFQSSDSLAKNFEKKKRSMKSAMYLVLHTVLIHASCSTQTPFVKHNENLYFYVITVNKYSTF